MHSDLLSSVAESANCAQPAMAGPNTTLSINDAGSLSPRDIGSLLLSRTESSPMTRAGLLQPRSYTSSSIMSFKPRNVPLVHTQDDIRDSTMQISNIPLRARSPQIVPHSQDSFIFPDIGRAPDDAESTNMPPPSISMSSTSINDLAASTSTLSSTQTGAMTPRGSFHPSGLSLLLARHEDHSGTTTPGSDAATRTPTVEHPDPVAALKAQADVPQPIPEVASPPSDSRSESSESAPLLSDLEAAHRSYHSDGDAAPVCKRAAVAGWRRRASGRVAKSIARDALQSVPAVILGTLLNILDGISYGMIIFPAMGVFGGLGGAGVSMFFVSAIIAQLVYSAGGSGFAGANGSMMIEVVPFFHILANSIADQVEDPHAVLATTMIAFSLSSLLTGMYPSVHPPGSLIGFFPRHILVGCIGGVGVFLIITGLTVCTRMADDDFALNFATFKYLVLNVHNLALWLPAFGLAVLLRVITHKYDHQLIFPLCKSLPYLSHRLSLIRSARLDLGMLRRDGWLFDMGTTREPWYQFYSYYDFKATRWSVIWATLPTQFALLFFNMLHPPLNVPALSVSLDHDVNTDKELVAHGYSNLLSGALGTVPNYLVYVNTLLFYRVGGVTRTAGFMLAGATTVLLLVGSGPIAYIPVMVVGALIFVLGIDLVKEALWDTRQRVSRMEYITIASIMICMTVWDFVIGVLFGIIVSCFFFVVQSSQRRSIRAIHSGETVMSTVRRPGAHRAYIREVSKQTTILRLQGFMFFGTITHVEETIRGLLDEAVWHRHPIRFLILDLSLVAGVDMSAAEAFVRVQRLLSARKVVLVFCGFSVDSPVGRALGNVGLLEMDVVELFATFNDALEWTENVYLRAWFASQKAETHPVVLPGRQDFLIAFQESVATTPRRAHLIDAGWRTIARDHPDHDALTIDTEEPFNTLVRAFSTYGPIERDRFAPLLPFLERIIAPEGAVLWKQGDDPDGLYIVESGILRAVYHFSEPTPRMEESMVPGTIAGELSALSGLSRNATCIVERQAVVWKLSLESMRRLETQHPDLAREFTMLVLKAAKLDYDILITALATRQ
ncbi:Uncharacterized protein C24H6.11c [Grifola frondosa]|uniref:Uncharacterized protein C24H6.11c n=1 Tax=Grifola frondosa TaxID=5627 RepID=A0A1C7MAR2_GRIFR|nr:Uncharacterized protein C24H6.11c [Grifola frondosa]